MHAIGDKLEDLHLVTEIGSFRDFGQPDRQASHICLVSDVSARGVEQCGELGDDCADGLVVVVVVSDDFAWL